MIRGKFRALWADKRRRKPYLAALLLAALYVFEIFVFSGFLGLWLGGFWGTVAHELVLAGIGVGVFLLLRGRLRVIFPFRRAEWSGIAGTVFLWFGVLLVTVLVTVILSFFFPEQMLGAENGVDEMLSGMPVWLGLLVVALEPAVCEEIAFRGAFLSCFRGMKNKWAGILITALFFGACHGSVWRMIPTAILGAAMGYLLFETENMTYNILFHFINNAFSVILTAISAKLDQLLPAETEASAQITLSDVGTYLIFTAGAPFLIYIGNYLLHRGRPGYDRGLFPKEKRGELAGLLAAAAGFLVLGTLLILIAAWLKISY